MRRTAARAPLGMSAAAPQPPLRGAEQIGGARPPEENRQEQLLLPSGQALSEAPGESGSGEGQQQQQEDDEEEDHSKWQRGRPPPQPHLAEAPPPKENPWTRWKPPPAPGGSLSPSSASAGSEFALQDPGEERGGGVCLSEGEMSVTGAVL